MHRHTVRKRGHKNEVIQQKHVIEQEKNEKKSCVPRKAFYVVLFMFKFDFIRPVRGYRGLLGLLRSILV